MGLTYSIKRVLSYILEIPIAKYQSKYSGNLVIALHHGKKVLNTDNVNYSFNSLHRVFQEVFKKSKIDIGDHSSILVLGLGGGSIPEIIRNEYQCQGKITAVEIDPVVIDIAQNQFNIKQYDPIEIIEKDAQAYMEEVTVSYDIICVDLFIHDLVPKTFLTIDFLQLLMSHLNPNGQLYFNVMVSNSAIQSTIEELIEYLKSQQQMMSYNFRMFDMEENNRVLVVKKVN